MNQKKTSTIFLLVILFMGIYGVGFGNAIQGSPKCQYLTENLSPYSNYLNIKNNSPSDFYKVRNMINNSERVVVTGYEIGYNSSGSVVNVSISSSEWNNSVSQIDTIPVNDSTNRFRKIFTNTSDYFFAERNFNLSMEVQQGNNPIGLVQGAQFSDNAFYWDQSVSKWTRYTVNQIYLAAIVEPVEQISVGQNVAHKFDGTTLDGYLDAFYFHTSDFSHESALRFRIEKTVNLYVGNITVKFYNAKSGAGISQLFQLSEDILPTSLATKTFDFDVTKYQNQGFYMVIRSIENKAINYNLTMSYINPPSSDNDPDDDGDLLIIGVVVFAVIGLGGIGFYFYKRNQ